MKETITREMIEVCQKAIHNADYDFDKLNVTLDNVGACDVVRSLFPQIIDLALQHLKIKASRNLVQWMPEPEPKTCNIDWTKEKGLHLKNRVLPVFDWNLVKI